MSVSESEPLVSILTPSYNQGKYIEENIKSVRNQTTCSFEHIVVDANSSDSTVDILKNYEDQYNLKWISEEDRGQSHALNKALDIASGDWVGWQNADDYYVENAFGYLANTIREQNPDVVYGDVKLVDSNSNEISRLYKTTPSNFVQRYRSLFASNQSAFVRREVLIEVGGFNEDYEYCMDVDLFTRLLKGNYTCAQVPEVIGCFRRHSEAKTHDNHEKQIEELSCIYNYSNFEQKGIVQSLAASTAKAYKALLLLRQGRLNAIKYKFSELV